MALCGGIGEVRPATAEIQAIADSVRDAVEQDAKEKKYELTEYTAVSFRSQVVAGINYFIKVGVGNNKFIEMKVYQNLQQELSLTSIEDASN